MSEHDRQIPPPCDRPGDFDPLVGSWHVTHRRLRSRLTGCDEWDEFTGTSTTSVILDGFGVVEDNWIDLPGDPYRALALRTYDPSDGCWAIWWCDSRNPHHLAPPVIGRFDDGTGTFRGDDTIDGQPAAVRFIWSGVVTPTPRWEQAFSTDGGITWETNWTMDFTRADRPLMVSPPPSAR